MLTRNWKKKTKKNTMKFTELSSLQRTKLKGKRFKYENRKKKIHFSLTNMTTTHNNIRKGNEADYYILR